MEKTFAIIVAHGSDSNSSNADKALPWTHYVTKGFSYPYHLAESTIVLRP